MRKKGKKVNIDPMDLLVLIANGNDYDNKTPGDRELALEYDCSIWTIQKRKDNLVKLGLATRIQGGNQYSNKIRMKITDYGRKCIKEGEIIG